MIQAEIKGKIPEIENLEDVLTSDVFGLLKYISNRILLLRILSYAKNFSGRSLLKCIDFDLETYQPEFIFWESMGKYGEPDLIVKFKKQNEPDLIICIEVKYYSSKSGEGDNDQLKRYFDGLVHAASLSKSTFLGVVYVTKYPSGAEIADTLRLIKKSRVAGVENKLFQLRWFEITEAIQSCDITCFNFGEKLIIEDLLKYLYHKNLVSFSKYSFQTIPFNLRPCHNYTYSNFKEFTFQHENFDNPINGKIFYGD